MLHDELTSSSNNDSCLHAEYKRQYGNSARDVSTFKKMKRWKAGCGMVVLTFFSVFSISLILVNQKILNTRIFSSVFKNVLRNCTPPIEFELLTEKLANHQNWNAPPVYKTISNITEEDPDWIEKVDTCYIYGKKKVPRPAGILDEINCKKRIPSAMVVGVKKCGTGALSRSLDSHPAVSMSREVHFPAKSVDNHSVAEWVGMMPLSSPNQLPMTENPQFLFSIRSIFLGLKEYLNPNARFIVITRDPVQRAISDYLHLVAHSDRPIDTEKPFRVKYKRYFLRETFEKTVVNPINNSIDENLNLFIIGKYIQGIKAALKVYHREQFLFVDGDAFAQDPLPSLLEIESFLGLPKFYKRSHFKLNKERGFFCAYVPERPDFECMIPSKGRPHPLIDEDLVQKLYDMYRPYNKALAEEFGLSFPWLFK